MDEQELQELNLEDILKEFGGPAPEEDVPLPEEEDLPGEDAEPQPELPDEEDEEVTGDTIRLDKIQKAVAASPLSQDTAIFCPIEEDDALEQPPAAPEADHAEAEAFPEDWEPEYEDMGDYTPPIAFKPKSRLQHLRAKLVAGPERLYYEIAEAGFGKLQAGIFLNFVIFLLCTCSMAVYALGLVGEDRLRLLVYLQLLCVALAALVGCYRILNGLGDLLRLKFSLNSWLALASLLCITDALLCLGSLRLSCGSQYCLMVLAAQIAAYQRRATRMQQMDALRKASEVEALVPVEEHFGGKAGFASVPGDPDIFMETFEAPSTPELVLQLYGLGSLVVSIGLGIYMGIAADPAAGVQTAAAAALISMPVSAFISHSRPENLLQKRLHKLGSVLCGWKGIRAVPKKAVYPLHHEDLYPLAAIKLNGVKFLGERSPDTVVCYAASLARADGGGLAPLLEQMLYSRNGRILPVEDFHNFDGGVSGVVDGQPVVLGTLEFMERMGISIPKGTKVAQAVCLAIDGTLSGLFAVTYNRSRSANAGLRTLCGYRNLNPVMVSCDFMLNREFISKRFDVNISRLILPEYPLRRELQEKMPADEATVIALTTREGLAPKAFSITGGRMLRTAWKLGTVIHLLGGALGLAAAVVLTLTGGLSLLTPENLLLYSLIWAVPGTLVTQWTRVI